MAEPARKRRQLGGEAGGSSSSSSSQFESSSSACGSTCQCQAPPLHLPSCHGTILDLQRMQQLLEQDSDALERTHDLPYSENCRLIGFTDECLQNVPPVHAACLKGHLPCAEFLLEAGADPNVGYEIGRNAVFYAAYSVAFIAKPDEESASLVQMLINHGAKLNFVIPPTHRYFEIGENDTIKSTHFKCPVFQSQFGNAIFPCHALHNSINAGHSETLQVLLDAGAVVEPIICSATSSEFTKPLYPTIAPLCSRIVGPPNMRDRSITTPLSWAIDFLMIDMVKILLKNGAQPSVFYLMCSLWGQVDHIVEYPIFFHIASRQRSLPRQDLVNLITMLYKTGADIWAKMTCSEPNLPFVYKGKELKNWYAVYREKGRSKWNDYWEGENEERPQANEYPVDYFERLNVLNESEVLKEICVEMRQMMSFPRKLQDSCRLVIRDCIGGIQYQKKVSTLPVPEKIVSFLKFNDIDSGEEMEESECSDEDDGKTKLPVLFGSDIEDDSNDEEWSPSSGSDQDGDLLRQSMSSDSEEDL